MYDHLADLSTYVRDRTVNTLYGVVINRPNNADELEKQYNAILNVAIVARKADNLLSDFEGIMVELQAIKV